MEKKILTLGLVILMAISLTACSTSNTSNKSPAVDKYKDYKQYTTEFGLKYKLPKNWSEDSTDINTELTYTKDGCTAEDGMIGVYYYEFDGDITQKDNFRSLVNNIKNMENYSGDFYSESSNINGIKAKRYSYKLVVNSNEYTMNGITFNCGNGYSILNFIFPSNKNYSNVFTDIANSISIDTSAVVTATEKQTEVPTTEEVTEASTQSTTETKKKNNTTHNIKDINTFDIIFAGDYRNDTTGKWKLATTSDSFDIQKYAVSYYNNYFKSDDEIHIIVNFSRMTTTKISNMGGILDISIYDYVKGEEHDAKEALSGTFLNEYHVNISSGKITKIQ